MGNDHRKSQQQSFSFSQSTSARRFCHGGVLYQTRLGRGQRPLSCREPLHLVFKVRREKLRSGSLRSSANHQLIHEILRRYAKRFFIKVEQVSVQGDHLHALIRTTRRSFYHHFFRVVAGQIAQRFEKEGRLKLVNDTQNTTKNANKNSAHRRTQPSSHKTKTAEMTVRGTGLWRYRPYTRVVRGWKAYQIVRKYVQLNEQEALGKIIYRKERLKGMSSADWEIL